MFEAKKTNLFRGEQFAKKYLSGRVLDIGAGADLVCPQAQPFDLNHGDANFIDTYFGAESFDVVHSSHCLEHMNDPIDALNRWWSLVKLGGYLIVVVPDEALYEQGIWPSLFNADHKSAFSLDDSSSAHHILNIQMICSKLVNAELVNVELQDLNYSYDLLFPKGTIVRVNKPRWLDLFFRVLKRVKFMSVQHNFLMRQSVKFGYPVDQTMGNALAQIQIIVKKTASITS